MMYKLPQDINKIAVFRALQLGDMLCAIPAMRALRTAFPDAYITLLGLPWASSFARRFSAYFDAFIHFPGYPGLPEQAVNVAQLPSFFTAMQRQRFDLVLQMQGNGSIVNPMLPLLGGRYTAGFRRREDYCPDSAFFLEYPQRAHEIERHLLLMQFLGIPPQGKELEFPVTARDLEEFDALSFPFAAREYVCIHPGSRSSSRQWPPHLFAAVADHHAARGWKIVLTGTQDERVLTAEVEGMMRHSAYNMAGATTIGSLAVLLRNARLLFSNCTGVSHMAAALRTPSLIISMDGEAFRWAPLNRELHHTIDWTRRPYFRDVLQQSERLLSAPLQESG